MNLPIVVEMCNLLLHTQTQASNRPNREKSWKEKKGKIRNYYLWFIVFFLFFCVFFSSLFLIQTEKNVSAKFVHFSNSSIFLYFFLFCTSQNEEEKKQASSILSQWQLIHPSGGSIIFEFNNTQMLLSPILFQYWLIICFVAALLSVRRFEYYSLIVGWIFELILCARPPEILWWVRSGIIHSGIVRSLNGFAFEKMHRGRDGWPIEAGKIHFVSAMQYLNIFKSSTLRNCWMALASHRTPYFPGRNGFIFFSFPSQDPLLWDCVCVSDLGETQQ